MLTSCLTGKISKEILRSGVFNTIIRTTSNATVKSDNQGRNESQR